MGFDGIEFADCVEPTLTTCRRELGQHGTALLLRAMLGERIPPHEARLRLPATALVRDSTGPAPEEDPA